MLMMVTNPMNYAIQTGKIKRLLMKEKNLVLKYNTENKIGLQEESCFYVNL